MCSAMTLLFEHDRLIHRFHFKIPEHELWKKCTQKEEWRSELKVGDMIDVYVRADERSRHKGWMQGTVSQVLQDMQDSLIVTFNNSLQLYDTKISRWSLEVMKFESHTKEDYKWRREVLADNVDFECEVHDKSNWNKATILGYKTIELQSRTILMANCALRVYRDIPGSTKKDERGTYEGWSDRFDEWVPVFSPRIIPWGSNPSENKEVDTAADEIDDLFEPT